jgi:hypothetical protein
MKLRSCTIRKGTLVYHGTSCKWDTEREGLQENSWVSRSRSVAEWFCNWHESEDGTYSIITYRVSERIPDLLIIDKDVLDYIRNELGLNISTKYNNDETLRELGFKGWVIPDNYDDGDDIFLLDPDRYLRHVSTEIIERGNINVELE